MGKLFRIGYQYLYTVRHQTIVTLGAEFGSRGRFSIREWVQTEELELIPYASEPYGDVPSSHSGISRNYATILNLIVQRFEFANRDELELAGHLREAMTRTSGSDHAEEDDWGVERAGGWDPVPFVLRGGIIHLFGAREFFERGVLRALFFYVPDSASKPATLIAPELRDFQDTETAGIKDLERRLDKPMHSCKGRWDVLTNQFGLRRMRGTNQAERLQGAWEDRNDIAHGLSPVEVTFFQFLQTYFDVFAQMRHLSEQCRSVLNIDI